MPIHEWIFMVLTFAGAGTGTWAIWVTRRAGRKWQTRCGWSVLAATLIVLGAATLVAATTRAYGLAPLGLSTGFLLIAAVSDLPQLAMPALRDKSN